jgi:diguanylate cyclase (GGDEF)-like protein/PAS domain S-box-containing protein
MKILIADDSTPDQALLSMLVKELGHDVITVENGADAVLAVEEQHPNLILMDIMMPIEDGLSATARIRELKLEHWLPIILLSALDQPLNIIKGLDAGADDYLTRPIHPKIIQAKIRAMERIKDLQTGYHQAIKLKEQHLSHLRQENHLHNQLRRAMDVATIVVETDANGDITYSNNKFCELSGYKQEELLGQNHRIFKSGVHTNEFFTDLWQTVLSGNVWHGDICNKTKSGQLYWLRTTIIPFLDEETGKPISYKSIRFDITERKQLETNLQLEKERAEITLSSIADGIIKTDQTGKVLFINKVVEEITGWPLEKAFNKDIEEVFTVVNKKTKQKIGNPITNIFTDKNTSIPADSILISRNGDEFDVEGLSSPLFENTEFVGCVLVFQNTTDNNRLKTEVEWQTWHDALTGLPNRNLLNDRFNIAIANANRTETVLAVCMLDLDDFKIINDEFGQAVGDQILVETATRLNDVIRDDDTASRLGGDEFVLLLNGFTSREEVDVTVQRIYKALSQPIIVKGHTFNISQSIGIATYPKDNVDADTLLRHADQAMYQAKRLGRKRFTYFDQDSEQISQKRLQEINRIRQAIFDDEMVLFYQPKVNMRTGNIIGSEALIRWQNPERGLLNPAEFLPQIESTDVDIDLGNWVIEQALIQLEQWQNQGKNWTVSVNIAGHHFTQDDFIDKLKLALDRHPNIPAQQLELEILETTALDDIAHVSNLICDCQALGVKFSLDDFGTGYSSLSYLRQLPANWLKIDQSFVRDMLDDRSDMALVEGIISLCHVFQRQVIAEGVETAEHGVLLMRLGCQYAQGYGIAKPMPAQDIIKWSETYQPDETWSIWSGSEWELSDLPLLVAQHDHIKWIQEILNTFDSGEMKLSEGELTNHFECRLGNWYYGHGKQHYGHLDSFQALESMHIEIHRLGYKVVKLLKEGKTQEARLVADELLNLKTKILTKLHELQKQVNFSGDKALDISQQAND